LVGVEYLLAVEFALRDKSGHVRALFCKTADFDERTQARMQAGSALCVGKFRLFFGGRDSLNCGEIEPLMTATHWPDGISDQKIAAFGSSYVKMAFLPQKMQPHAACCRGAEG
jgi:hypothetical protein